MWFARLRALQGEAAKGPMPTFSLNHILLAVMLIDVGYVGRKQLAHGLGLGEGATRTLIGKLKGAGLARTIASGCTLTQEGRLVSRELLTVMRTFQPPSVGPPGREASGVRLRGLAGFVARGLEERDAAVRAGADGAMVLVKEDGRIKMPGLADMTQEHPEEADALQRSVDLADGDVALISWAESKQQANAASMAAAVSVLSRSFAS